MSINDPVWTHQKSEQIDRLFSTPVTSTIIAKPVAMLVETLMRPRGDDVQKSEPDMTRRLKHC